ncbi:MAG: rRNA (uracil1498-N3)-methyltransferase [Eubacteriaceae bacterium]|nr:rRNA (uracil1498-N3)-methyltransferase [Eubacteriaceae bacterium]MDK2904160.1 rRNA (uracil1498-N3)-methyltransferase [Eubacteriaceae bacterium]
MHRFFVDISQIHDENLTITGEDFKHLTRVLRLKINDQIEVCDGQGWDYQVVIQSFTDKEMIGKILGKSASEGENADFEITLFQGIPKGSKMETIVQKNVELGVMAIVPFASKRAVSEIEKKEDKKIERWQRIAYEAAKQSKRGIIPKVLPLLKVKGVCEKLADFDLVLLAYEDEEESSLKKVLANFIWPIGEKLRIAVIIGPEGGFDPEEVALLTASGAKSVSLGKRILRTETAGMLVIGQVNFWKE